MTARDWLPGLLVLATVLGALWLASAVGYWLTGVPG